MESVGVLLESPPEAFVEQSARLAHVLVPAATPEAMREPSATIWAVAADCSRRTIPSGVTAGRSRQIPPSGT